MILYRGDLRSGHIWISNDQNEVGLQMVRSANGINLDVRLFESRQMATILPKTI